MDHHEIDDVYRAGLDVKSDSTGTHSVYTSHRDIEIMYHVSTLLPHSAENAQQLHRKRHIGNDIVVLIFNDGKTPFDPSWLRSNFNHVFVVVQPDCASEASASDATQTDASDAAENESEQLGESESDATRSELQRAARYKVSVVCKTPMPQFPPKLPERGIFVNNSNFKEWLLCKLINAERAAYHAPAFRHRITGTRRALINDLIEKNKN